MNNNNSAKKFIQKHIFHIYAVLIIICTSITLFSDFPAEKTILFCWMPILALATGFCIGLYTDQSPIIFKNPVYYQVYNEKLRQYGIPITIISGAVTTTTYLNMLQAPNIVNTISVALATNLTMMLGALTFFAKKEK